MRCDFDMKIAFYVLAVCLGIAGCKDSARPIRPEAEAVPPKAEANEYQTRSTVRVRVMAGLLPEKDFTGALLHHDELKGTGTYFDENRCVLALLGEFTESQLGSDKTRIIVIRNLPNESGPATPFGYPGKLIHFDRDTGVAMIRYEQGFAAELDVGFRFGNAPARLESSLAFRFVTAPGQRPVRIENRPLGIGGPFVGLQKMSLASGNILPGNGEGIRLKFVDGVPGALEDGGALMTDSSNVLHGFFAGKDGAAKLVPVQSLPVKIQLPEITLKSVSFSVYPGGAEMGINVGAVERSAMPPTIYAQSQKLPPDVKPDLDNEMSWKPFFPRSTYSEALVRSTGDALQFKKSLATPLKDGGSVSYIVRVAWEGFQKDGIPFLKAKPFVVRFSQVGGETKITTEGIAYLNEGESNRDVKFQSFNFESPVTEVTEIAGGNEVLFRLAQAPYWKRFSMTKRDWLPLPEADLATASLAGNRSSLFVLDRKAGELRSYNLSDLAPIATRRLDDVQGEISSIHAGCNSDRAPLFVLSSRDRACIDPLSLSRRDTRPTGMEHGFLSSGKRHVATGDGQTLVRGEDGERFTFEGDFLGLARGYFDSGGQPTREALVSAAFHWTKEGMQSFLKPPGRWTSLETPSRAGTTETDFTVVNCPVIVRAQPEVFDTIPSRPMRFSFFSFLEKEPFAEVSLPRNSMKINEVRHVTFAPESRSLGLLAKEKTSWTVYDVKINATGKTSALLNWPETSLVRGGDFNFKPIQSGEGKITAQLEGAKEPTPVTVNDSGVSFHIADSELAALLSLRLSIIRGEDVVEYPIPLYVNGPQLPFVSPDFRLKPNAESSAPGFRSLFHPEDKRLALKSTIYQSPDPVEDIIGPFNDHIGLVTNARRLDIVSLETHSVVTSMPIEDKVRLYPGGGGMLEYNATTRKLSRINVPDLKREESFTLPEACYIKAIGLGEEAEQPLVLFLERRSGEETAQFGNATVTTWDSNWAIVALNSKTLRSGGWMQPKVWTEVPDGYAIGRALGGVGALSDFPPRLIGSRDGTALRLPNHLLTLDPRYSVVAPFPTGKVHEVGPYFGGPPSGSITGQIAVSTNGAVHRNGKSGEGYEGLGVTPCGRYTLVDSEDSGLSVRVLEGERPLFSLNRITAFRTDLLENQFRNQGAGRALLIRDNGPLAIRSKDGRLIQFLDFDIPNIAKTLFPDTLHVTSQAIPSVIPGQTYEYQIQTNNPAIVTGYTAPDKTQNIIVSKSGLVRFMAPKTVPKPFMVNATIEIGLTNGKSVRHEFSVMVLPDITPQPIKASPPEVKPKAAI